MNALLIEVPLRRLPFSFAKRHGVVLLSVEGASSLVYRPGVELVALSEAQRQAGAVAVPTPHLFTTPFSH